LLLIFSVDR